MKSNSKDNLLNIEESLALGPAVSIFFDGYVDKGKIVSLNELWCRQEQLIK